MDKSGKIYVKAMNKYNDGYIDQSLALCEKSISINITNAAALNLRGILYYLKGDLENAKKMWNINYKRNHDEVSKKYLKDCAKDVAKLQLYNNALDLIVQYNIAGALNILEQCEKSHFNFINVNNRISLCYIKQGEYDKAQKYINEVLKVDKKNTEAITNKKTLIEYGSLKREINHKKLFIITGCLLLAITTILVGKTYGHNVKIASINAIKKVQSTIGLNDNKDKEDSLNEEMLQIQKAESTKKSVNLSKDIKNTVNDKSENEKAQETLKFPQEQFTESIKNKNMEQIIEFVNQWKGADLEINNKLLVVQGEEIIKKEGVLYFYKKGVNYMQDKNFIEAQKYFLYALPYSEDNYLKQHITYMLAISYKSISDFENTVKYYEYTLKQFPGGSYTEEILYNLILINKDVDLNKAKYYAEELVKQFPKSQYHNTIVKEILQ